MFAEPNQTTSQLTKIVISFRSVPDLTLTDGCELDWVASDAATCIRVHNEPLNWHEAETKCNKHGGHLVFVANVFVQQTVDAAITSR